MTDEKRGYNINHVHISGNLTRDPDIRGTQSGKLVANIQIACNTGRDSVLYLKCMLWNELSDEVSPLSKGDFIELKGMLVSSEWTRRDGTKVTEMLLNVSEVVRTMKKQAKQERTTTRYEPTRREAERHKYDVPASMQEAKEDDDSNIPF